MGKLGKKYRGKTSSKNPTSYFTNGLAIILTFGTIAVILSLVAFHQFQMMQNHETFQKVFDKIVAMPNGSQTPKDLFELFQNYYRETNTSNTNLLSILLPVIGAWVGAILAFYYGNKNFEKISDTLRASTLSSEEEKLAHLTVGEVLERMPEYKKVITAKITDPVGESYKKIPSNTSNLVIIDNNDHPLGIIYKTDFTRNSAQKEEDIAQNVNSLKSFFADVDGQHTPIRELIRNEQWTGNELNNFARLEKKDTLLEARTKMQGISPSPAVRGLVIEEDKVVGVVTYELFSNVLSKEDK